MRPTAAAALLTLALSAPAALTPPLAAQQVRFRGAVDVVRVDVIVRDREGNVVRGLTAGDFEITEDGKPQAVTTFDFEEILAAAAPADAPAPAVLDRSAAEAPASAARPVVDLPGRRLIVLFFDLSSMQPEDVERAAASARTYIDEEMSPADLLAIASLNQTLDVNQDFTADKDALRAVLDRFSGVDATPESPIADEVDPEADPADLPLDDSELSLFNNDRRLRALQVLAEALGPVQQKKSIVYFSSGMSRSGSDNQIELRATVNAAVRANAAIYAVDTRGLQAVVPGGDASTASARGMSAFSGRGAARQFDRMFASQETLTTLAKDTGGEAFFDTNDFGEAFDQVRQDSSAYYVLGYSSTNAVRDGRFRKIAVRVKTPGLRIEHRAGYYAAKDFTHFTRDDRERQLQEQLFSDVSSTDLPVVASASWFRLDDKRFYVPVSVAIPGASLPADRPARSTLDVLGSVRDEQGRYVGRIRDTVQLPAARRARAEAGAVPDRLHAAARPVLGEDRRAREREGRHRHVRGAGRGAGSRSRADEGQFRRRGHAAAAGAPARAHGQPAGARGRRADPEPEPRGRPGSAAVLLLRSVRPRPRCAGRAAPEDEPGVLSRPRESLRDAGRRAGRR